jgi:hypothetical protein
LPQYFQHGIYRCIISIKDTTRNYIGLFRFNKLNYYTHYDLKRAKELDLEIQMIEDGNNNFLYYSNDKLIQGTKLFGKFVDLLFGIKEAGLGDVSDKSKSILVSLWGALCQMNVSKKVVSNMEGVNTKAGQEVKSIIPYDENTSIIKLTNESKVFKYNYARIKPYLLANSRYKMSKLMEPYRDDIIRCHTDSMFLPYQLDPTKIELGCKLGQLKYKGYYKNFVMKNINDYDGEFTKIN